LLPGSMLLGHLSLPSLSAWYHFTHGDRKG
jgi:hypothetical protein